MILSISDAARYLDVTRQAVFVAIRNKRLIAEKKMGQWQIDAKDLQEYEHRKYNRDYSTYNGKPLFDKSQGELSIRQAAKLLDTSYHHIYYAIATKRLTASRKGSTWVINEQDVLDYGKSIRKRKRTWFIHLKEIIDQKVS